MIGLLVGRLPARGESGSNNAVVKEGASSVLEFIETDFENASPIWYEVATDGVVSVYLHSDNERGAPNRASGQLHPARAPVTEEQRSRERMAALEALLRKHTWFTEGSTKPTAGTISTLADGWLQRYGIDGAVHEFNCQWIAGLNERPSGRHWQRYGSDLARVLHEYFGRSFR